MNGFRRWLFSSQGGRTGRVALMAVAIGLCVWLCWWAVNRDYEARSKFFLQNTSRMALSLNLEVIQSLVGGAKDLENPAYQETARQMRALAKLNPDCVSLWLMGRREDGTVFIYLDVMPGREGEEAVAGEEYPAAEVCPPLLRCFEENRADLAWAVDRWGTQLSAMVPLADPRTGKVAVLVGMDVDRKTWQGYAIRALLSPMGFSVVMLGLLYVVLFQGRAWWGKGFQARNRDVWLTALFGGVLTLLVCWLLRTVGQQHLRDMFDAMAQRKAVNVLTAFRTVRDEELEAMAGLFVNNRKVASMTDFRLMVTRLTEKPEVRLWGWIPEVHRRERPGMEEQMQFLGLRGFSVWEKGETGEERPDTLYSYPLCYMMPYAGYNLFGGRRPGFNLGSDTNLLTLIRQAKRTGLTVSSELRPPLEGAEVQEHSLLLFPVEDSAQHHRFAGIVLAVLEPANLLEVALSDSLNRNLYMQLKLFELTPDAQPRHLLAAAGGESEDGEAAGPGENVSGDGMGVRETWEGWRDIATWRYVQPVTAFGRAYALVASPTGDFAAAHHDPLHWIVLVMGLFLTGGGTMAMRALVRRREVMEGLVRERTRDLSDSIERFNRLSSYSRSFSWEVDATGLVTDCTPSVVAVLGWRAEEMTGLINYHTIYEGNFMEVYEAQQADPQRRNLPFITLEARVNTKDGSDCWLRSHVHPVIGADGTVLGFQGTSSDVTIAHQAREEREHLLEVNREAAERYQALIDATGAGAWEYDDSTGHMWLGKSYYRLFGMNPDDFQFRPDEPNLDKVWLNQLHPDDRAMALAKVNSYMQNPVGMHEYVYRMRHADGRWLWVMARGSCITRSDGVRVVAGTMLDISATKQAEAELRSSEENYRIIAESMSDLVWVVDAETLKYTYVAPSSVTMFGRTPEELLNAPDILTPLPMEDSTRLRQMVMQWKKDLREHPETAPTESMFQHVGHRPDGTAFCAEAKVRYLRHPLTGIAEFHGVTRDITDRLITEQYREMGLRALKILSSSIEMHEQLQELTDMFKEVSGIDAAGIRLHADGYFPYAAHTGYPCGFLEKENDLRILGSDGHFLIEGDGTLQLRCACGRVLTQNREGAEPLFTPNGTCWTNDAIRDFSPPDPDAELPTCLASGFSSIALVPIRAGNEIIGLIQFNSLRKNAFTANAILLLETIAANIGEAFLRKRAEQDYRMLFHEMLEGFCLHEVVTDEAGKPVDFRFLSVNPAYERIMGVTQGETHGRLISEALPRAASACMAAYQSLLDSDRPVFYSRFAEYVNRWLEVTVFRLSPTQFAGIFNDITDRVRAEADRDRLAQAVEQSDETVVITNPEGVIVYANPAFETMTGHSARGAIGTVMHMLRSDLPDNGAFQERWKTLRSGKNWAGQVNSKRKDGTAYTESVSISPVLESTGQISCFIAIRHDITQKIANDTERENLLAQLRQANKMESIGRLAGGIAHDFNNMLQAILGYAEIALEEVPEEQPAHEDILAIQNVARRSAELTKQLLIFSRRQAGTAKVLDVNATIQNTLGILQRLLGSDIPVHFSAFNGISHIKVDPSRFDQILVNLCVNARDAIDGKGSIRIRTWNVQRKTPLVTLTGEIPAGDYSLLAVTDTGSGMSPDVVLQIFEPFFTTKKRGKGTGLGLAIVYGTVKQAGGGIRVRSKMGRGTTFEILLPLAKGDEVPEMDAADDPDHKAPHGSETVLVVDDEVAILKTTRRMLETLGYTVLSTSDPDEAMKMAMDPAVQLLISDVIMPAMNGPELVHNILAKRPKLPYFFMSGYTANLLAEHGLDNNSGILLAKPFSRLKIATQIRAILSNAKQIHPADEK